MPPLKFSAIVLYSLLLIAFCKMITIEMQIFSSLLRFMSSSQAYCNLPDFFLLALASMQLSLNCTSAKTLLLVPLTGMQTNIQLILKFLSVSPYGIRHTSEFHHDKSSRGPIIAMIKQAHICLLIQSKMIIQSISIILQVDYVITGHSYMSLFDSMKILFNVGNVLSIPQFKSYQN